MIAQQEPQTAIVLPVGPGIDSTFDTLASIAHYCPEPHILVIVDDRTQDGTYERLRKEQAPHWHILRNDEPNGIRRLVHTLCRAYRYILANTQARLVLRLDQDALVIKKGAIGDAWAFLQERPRVGLFGVYSTDYNRPRSFKSHEVQINKELSWPWRLTGGLPYWSSLLHTAELRGYQRGDNVFGGAYWVTRPCLESMATMGALDVPKRWHSRLMEDVYFSMATVAAGFALGHFSAPDGPMCLEWRGLPFPADELAKMPYKIIHSVDKGQNTGADRNGGVSAREVFRRLRCSEVSSGAAFR